MLREMAFWHAHWARQPLDGVIFTGPVRIKTTIAWPKGRKTCDFQAAVHALKAAVDGLEDAEIIANDSQVVGMDITQTKAEDTDGWFTLEISAVTQE